MGLRETLSRKAFPEDDGQTIADPVAEFGGKGFGGIIRDPIT